MFIFLFLCTHLVVDKVLWLLSLKNVFHSEPNTYGTLFKNIFYKISWKIFQAKKNPKNGLFSTVGILKC